MISADTNILTRYYLGDDKAQSPIALAVMKSPALFIPKTVVLEFSQVMRHVYRYADNGIYPLLEHLAELPNVTLECEDQILEALRHYKRGMDFADALHLAASGQCELLATFDKKFGKRAAKLELQPPVVDAGAKT